MAGLATECRLAVRAILETRMKKMPALVLVVPPLARSSQLPTHERQATAALVRTAFRNGLVD